MRCFCKCAVNDVHREATKKEPQSCWGLYLFPQVLYEVAIVSAEGYALQYNFLEHATAIVATIVFLEAIVLGYHYARVRVSTVGSYDRLAVAVSDSSRRSATTSFMIWQIAVIGTYFALFGQAAA